MILSVREPTPPPLAQTARFLDGPRTKFTVEYHPNSGRASETLEDRSSKHRSFTRPPDEPWHPYFRTREDFTFSQVLMEIGASKDQYDRLLKVVRTCIDGQGSLSLSNYSDMRGAWERASAHLTSVCLRMIFKFGR